MGKTIKTGGTQALGPDPLEQQEAELIASADILGIPPESKDSIFNSPELAKFQICRAAALILEHHSTIVDEIDAKGNKVSYRVSLGNEHFPVKKGILEDTLEQRGVMPGFSLRQQCSKQDQDAHPIYLVTTDTIEARVVTIMSNRGAIYRDGSVLEPLDEATDLREIGEIVAAIGLDSENRFNELQASKEHKKSLAGEKRRKRISRLAGAAGLALMLRFAVPPVVESAQNWNQDRIEQAANEKAEKRAAELQAKDNREEKVRTFDSKYDIDSSIAPTEAGAVGVAQPTDAFIDVRVPEYLAENIDPSLATNLGSPRAIAVPGISSEEGFGTSEVKIPINAGDEFRVAHNGSPTEVVNVKFDPASNTLTVIHSQPFGEPDVPATQIYIQKVGQ